MRNIKSLARRLSTLEKDRLRESNHLEASEISDAHERVRISIKRIITLISEEIASIEQEIDLAISSDSIMKKNHQLLLSVKQFSSAKQAAVDSRDHPSIKRIGKSQG
ncbi:hypothetical protein VIBNISOn1_1630002 [Vibrio nigripulchritudo SOn1]|uniref:Uncharacterized protein n=1 Tax=Vibrio nigripulchritudo SOn1 TaxID=1238450 RepID=A0AAV2VMZ3_9VIBR|nr:hypothetical protein VIBNISOn1_1630002 [Vibrio nigripulchritudo SOn1]